MMETLSVIEKIEYGEPLHINAGSDDAPVYLLPIKVIGTRLNCAPTHHESIIAKVAINDPQSADHETLHRQGLRRLRELCHNATARTQVS